MESLAGRNIPVSETIIQRLHALVMAGGQGRVGPTPYRDGQNAIRDSATGRLVYLSPEAHDVPALMKELVDWLTADEQAALPAPLRSAPE